MPINVSSHNQQIASLLAQPTAPMQKISGVPAATSQTPQGVAFRNTNSANNRAPALSVQPPHNQHNSNF